MSLRPLAIDLFCGLFGWAEGLVAEGWRVIGFDLEDMCTILERPRPPQTQLVIQDVLTLHGSQFRDADLIVGSPPCQFFAYCAMPWTRAKALAAEVRADPERLAAELALFEACFRIQREACEAAGRHIPLVVENVRGAQPWVGRARWNFGSYYLWGDVPALMPGTQVVRKGAPPTIHRGDGSTLANIIVGDGVKGCHGTSGSHWTNPEERSAAVKHHGSGAIWFDTGPAALPSSSPRRKAASAMLAKIPLPLARHIGAVYRPAIGAAT